eukprot:4426778-Prorocentrum_lima.AAC.1
MINQLHEIIPPWQPVKERLMSDGSEVAKQLMACEHFTFINTIAESLDAYSKNLKNLNVDGQGAI